MQRRLRNAGPGLAFAYVFFLLFPHFAAITHTHGDDGATHHHNFLSAHDLDLERAALETARQGAPNGELAPESGDEIDAATPTPPPQRSGIAVNQAGQRFANAKARMHTHVQEDPNLPVLTMEIENHDGTETTLTAHETVPAFVPALAILASPARAPPHA